MIHPIVNIATDAVRKAGTHILRSLDRLEYVEVEEKQHNDFVSEVDKKAELIIIDTIKKAYPEHAILAEESGSTEGDEHLWIIDPIDGTTNFLHDFSHFCISIAFQVKGKLEHGVIYDPIRNELFTASRGKGALLNSRKLRVSARKSLHGSLIGTGFPFRQQTDLDLYLQTFKAIATDVADIRRAGSAALDLAYVAAGRLDGFWEFGLSKWDIAAGILLVKEAGGMLSDLVGGENYYETGNVLAANPKILKVMLQKLQPICINA